VAWTNRVISPGIYNASNGFTVLWLFGQFRWSSCNKLALFSDLSEYHLLGALLEPSLPSRVEREETLNTPILLGGFWQDTDVHLDLFTAEAHTAAAGENASTAGRVEAEKEGRNRKPTSYCNVIGGLSPRSTTEWASLLRSQLHSWRFRGPQPQPLA
jgi:hypothetical protein